MDPNRDPENEESNCKYCYGTEDLMGIPICGCTGSMSNICRNCLRQSLASNTMDELNRHKCRDCLQPYYNIELVMRPPEVSFYEYLNRRNQFSGTLVWGGSIGVALVVINILYWFITYDFEPGAQNLISFIYLAFMVGLFCAGGNIGYETYQEHTRYLNRKPTVLIDVLPSVGATQDLPPIEYGYQNVSPVIQRRRMPFNDQVQFDIEEEADFDQGDDFELQKMAQKDWIPPKQQFAFTAEGIDDIPYIDEGEEEDEPEYQDTYL